MDIRVTCQPFDLTGKTPRANPPKLKQSWGFTRTPVERRHVERFSAWLIVGCVRPSDYSGSHFMNSVGSQVSPTLFLRDDCPPPRLLSLVSENLYRALLLLGPSNCLRETDLHAGCIKLYFLLFDDRFRSLGFMVEKQGVEHWPSTRCSRKVSFSVSNLDL